MQIFHSINNLKIKVMPSIKKLSKAGKVAVKGKGAQGYAQTAKSKANSSSDKVGLDRTSNTPGVKSGYRSEKAKTGAKPKAGRKMASNIYPNEIKVPKQQSKKK